MLPPFEMLEPKSLDEAVAALAGGGGAPLAGGTNLLPDLRARGEAPGRLVSLAGIKGLRGIDHGEDRVVMGAATTLADILRDPAMARAAPALVAAARVFGGAMVRTASSVGGNICYGSPAADVVLPLLSLDAEIRLVGAEGERRLALAEFFLDYKKTARRPNEILTAVSWAPPEPDTANLFYKLGRRRGDAITVVGVAVTLAAGRGRCTKARIALGALAPTPFRARAAEAALEGAAPTPDRIEAAAGAAAQACRPIDDIRASAEYRLHAAHVLVRRLLTQAWARIAGR